jgi:hypothetical protein
MYPYTKELTLDEALQLQLVAPETKVYYPSHQVDDYEGAIKDYYLDRIYANNNFLQCDALTYAIHILKQQTPPEGWGYAAYELSSGKYDKLEYCFNFSKNRWHNSTAGFSNTRTNATNWHEIAFRLTDLARVEKQTETAPIQPPSADWEAKYNQEKSESTRLRKALLESEAKYNKAILQRNTTDWEAKYKELEFKYNEDEIFNCKNKQRINDLEVENYKLKNYIINQLLNN